MEDPDPGVRDMCAQWWSTRDIFADHALFQKGGEHHRPRQYNAARCWAWQVRQFLHTPFEYTDAESGETRTAMPRDLPAPLVARLVAQLSCHVGIFHGKWLPLLRVASGA